MMITIPEPLDQQLKKYEGRFPLPVVALANDSGIDVYETDELRNTQSGLIKKEGAGYAIYVNEKHPATRKIFTIAHEIAHFHLHKDLLDKGEEHIDSMYQPVDNGSSASVLNRQNDAPLTPDEELREQQANQLAAQMLMPDKEFIEAFKTSATIEEVAEKFGVSSAAATIRAKNLLKEVIF